jgi:valyl-tRNA synthetase
LAATLPTRFDPKPVEARWSRAWIVRGVFHAEADDPRPPFSLVIPPPNVTGSLHLGHALNNTLQDVLARHKRLQGFNVCWMPGTDHAGIATQVVVERELEAEGKTRHDLGREAFVDRVWEWKARSGARILEQLQALGASCDWARERFTMDPGLSRAVREVFVRLYREKLIYRDVYLVNWCPRCSTVLSDLESPHRPVQGRLYRIRYPLVDAEGAIEVETTRPETLLGDTAVAVHPDDERHAHQVGRTVRLPLLGRPIPIVADTFVDREYGSGAVKVTPGHDPNDFACAQRLGLPVLNILHHDGRLNANAGPYEGLGVAEARRRVVLDLEREGLLVGSREHLHEVPHCDRCDTVVEPIVSEQWFMKMEPLARPALEAVREGRTTFHPRSWEKTYFHWLENIQPWVISRQLWWGHRIPAWHCAQCDHWTVSVEDPDRCEACGSGSLRQDEDVLDTWFSSALWPFSTFGWPDATPELELFYPTAVLSTAHDIIFFWVARMMMMGLHFLGDVPFRDVYIHPLIRDAEGKKMSKSRGNVIDPLEIMSAHGTDALRYTLVSLSAQGRDIRLGESALEGGRAFVTKLWNAARFALMHLEPETPGGAPSPAAPRSLYDRWILDRMDRALVEFDRALEAFRFNDAAAALYRFVWGELCDWYIELAKLPLQGDDAVARRATRTTLVQVLRGALTALHPIMPFVTEEIATSLPDADGSLLLEQRYPQPGPPLPEAERREMDALVEVVSRIRQVRGELGLPPRSRVAVTLPEAARPFAGRHAAAIAALAQTSPPSFSDRPPSPTASVIQAAGFAIAVELDQPELLGDEIRRLEKGLGKLEKDLAYVARKLENPQFLERAKADVVEAERSRYAALAKEVEQAQARLARLRAASGSER